MYSEILDKYMSVVLTDRALNLIDQHKGFDNYILETPVQDFKSKLALDLRRKMLVALAKKDFHKDNQEMQNYVQEKYKAYLIPVSNQFCEGKLFETNIISYSLQKLNGLD